MSNPVTIVGIDPGLVHTGVVVLKIEKDKRLVSRIYTVVDRIDVALIERFVKPFNPSDVYIEDYNPRKHYSGDKQMIAGVLALKKMMPQCQLINNTGANKIVRRPLMDMLNVWTFPTPTHHQDLRAAARIALYGALKEDAHNKTLFEIVEDTHYGISWTIQ